MKTENPLKTLYFFINLELYGQLDLWLSHLTLHSSL